MAQSATLARHSHRRQHRAAPDLARRAGGARADHHSGEVERHHLRRRRDAAASRSHSVLASAAPRRRRPGIRARGDQPALGLVPQRRDARAIVKAARRRGGRRRRSRRCRERSRCRRAVPAPGRRRRSSAPARVGRDDERAHALRTADLVRRQRHQIGARAPPCRARSLPAACIASVCSSAPCACASRAAAATSWIAPVSLLASMSETSAGRGSVAEQPFKRSKIGACRRARTGRMAASGLAARTESCSIAETMTRRRPRPRSARWLASLPPLVKMTADGGGAGQRRDRLARVLDRVARGAAPAMHGRGIAAARQRLAPSQRRLPAAPAPSRSSRDRSARAGSATATGEPIAPQRRRRAGGVAPVAVERAAAPEDTALAHIGERDRAEIEVDLVAEFLPQIMGEAPAACCRSSPWARPACSAWHGSARRRRG